MVIFHSYVSLPEGRCCDPHVPWWNGKWPQPLCKIPDLTSQRLTHCRGGCFGQGVVVFAHCIRASLLCFAVSLARKMDRLWVMTLWLFGGFDNYKILAKKGQSIEEQCHIRHPNFLGETRGEGERRVVICIQYRFLQTKRINLALKAIS